MDEYKVVISPDNDFEEFEIIINTDKPVQWEKKTNTIKIGDTRIKTPLIRHIFKARKTFYYWEE